ncbi:MAG: acylneuraminate cytidylyltransferase family protein [Nitrososphaerota archaeon]|nr:acylneuraminate cytidylyltransferase family protein [Candidatus Bathyarchaeota archaeon]MDW8194591.1 acylneuraminate cytidylyltransferase family protein [Nitrososphaerota archaeon]
MGRIQKSSGEDEGMIGDKKVLAIIPARGGSKGLPRKNIKPLLGKPLIVWTIEQGKRSKYIDRLIVSSEDKEIIQISLNNGAEVIGRPAALAQDDTPTYMVLLHVLEELEKKGEFYHILVVLEPTSPLRETEDIDKALEIMVQNKNSEAIVSVCKATSVHPEFMVKINELGLISKYCNGNTFKTLRRQDVDDAYFFDGTIYISYIDAFKREKSFYHNRTAAYVVPKWKSFEIDDEVDFLCVESILKNLSRVKNDGIW